MSSESGAGSGPDTLPSLDAATEAALLASIAPAAGGGGGSRKRQREERQARPCHAFADTGACKFGALCKFSHAARSAGPGPAPLTRQSAEAAARSLLRGLTTERARRVGEGGDAPDEPSIVGATGEGADCGGGDGGGGDGGGDGGGSDGGDNCGEPHFAPTSSAFEELPALSASTITPLTYVQRYYTRLFLPDGGVPSCRGQDHYVHLQSNRVCIVGVAPAHPAARAGSRVVAVDFSDALRKLAVSGKRKRGSVAVEPGYPLARVRLADGRSYVVRACLSARVLEVNRRLETEPGLLGALPETAGFVAILELQLAKVVAARATLLSEARYAQLLACRGQSAFAPASAAPAFATGAALALAV